MFRYLNIFSGVFLLLSLLSGCGKTSAPQIDASLAYRLAVEAAAIGPRPSGSPLLARQADWIAATAGKFGAKTKIDTFEDQTPQGTVTFRNVIATVPGKNTSQYILIACHYDTKQMFSDLRFVGANDGASGVGALLAMIKATCDAPQPPPLTLRFVFFDGEECLYQYGPNDGLHGSRFYATQLEKNDELKSCRAMILLDMIGDRDFKLSLPLGTSAELARLAQAAATRLGHRDRIDWHHSDMIDDHTPFIKKGVPSIDLIDFNYGPDNAWWHTAEDTIDKLSPESIAIAANIGLAIAWDLRSR